MNDLLQQLLSTDSKLLMIYVIVYFFWGILMHNFGIYTRIARFRYWWQIITCYIFYMIPISILLRDLAWYEQYVYGLFFMGILEFAGYWLKTSIAFENNVLERFFGVHNFTLGMTLFFAAYFPLGNALVELLADLMP